MAKVRGIPTIQGHLDVDQIQPVPGLVARQRFGRLRREKDGQNQKREDQDPVVER